MKERGKGDDLFSTGVIDVRTGGLVMLARIIARRHLHDHMVHKEFALPVEKRDNTGSGLPDEESSDGCPSSAKSSPKPESEGLLQRRRLHSKSQVPKSE